MKQLGGWLLGMSMALLLVACSSTGTIAKNSQAVSPTATIDMTSTLTPQLTWRHVVNYGSGAYFLHLLPVITKEGTMIVASYKGSIDALDSHTGKHLWRRHYRYHFVSGVALNHDLLFVTTEDGHLLAIRQSNGCIVWSVVTSSQVLASPQVGGDLVFAHATDGVLTAYVAANGEISWQQRESQPQLMMYLGSQPVVVGDKVLCGFANGRLVAFNLTDGHQLWVRQVAEPEGVTEVSRMVDITSRPVVIDDAVYVVNYQGNLMSLSLNDGHVFWKHKLSAFANIAPTLTRLYLTDVDGNVWAFDRRTGAVVWQQTHLANHNLSAPAVIGSTVVTGDARGYVYWLSIHDGHFMAHKRLSRSSLLTQPLVAGNLLYFYFASGKLLAYKGQ